MARGMDFDRMHELIAECWEVGDRDSARELQEQLDAEVFRLAFSR